MPSPPPPPRRFTRAVRSLVGLSALVLAGGAFLVVTGCSSAGRADVSETAAPYGAAPASMTMTGTMRDLEPAIRYAASQNEMAILGKPKADPTDPDVHIYNLITVVDEPVTLTVRLPEGTRPEGVVAPGLAAEARMIPSGAPFEMTASIEIAFGYPERERVFLRTLRDRLSALAKGDGIAKGSD